MFTYTPTALFHVLLFALIIPSVSVPVANDARSQCSCFWFTRGDSFAKLALIRLSMFVHSVKSRNEGYEVKACHAKGGKL